MEHARPPFPKRFRVASDPIHAGHATGTAEMPIWGSTFADIKTHRVVTMRVADMIRYLESIQAK
jgi:hypothetical protein